MEFQLGAQEAFETVNSDWVNMDCNIDENTNLMRSYSIKVGDGVSGKYNLMGKITKEGTLNTGTMKRHDIEDGIEDGLYEGNSVDNQEVQAHHAIRLEHLLNPIKTNDGASDRDEVNLAIYSDVLDQTFACGTYSISSGNLVDFRGLVVPCKEHVAISIHEDDTTTDEVDTIIIPCSA